MKRLALALTLLLPFTLSAETLVGKLPCTIAWDFPVGEEAKVAAFPIFINGSWAYGARPNQRSVSCSEVGIREPGTYAFEMFTRAKPDSGASNSIRVKHVIEIETAKPVAPLNAPTNVRIQP